MKEVVAIMKYKRIYLNEELIEIARGMKSETKREKENERGVDKDWHRNERGMERESTIMDSPGAYSI